MLLTDALRRGGLCATGLYRLPQRDVPSVSGYLATVTYLFGEQ